MRLVSILLALLLPLQPHTNEQLVTGPARVIDGDTLDIAGTRIRLHGIDAPEAQQSCQHGAGRPYGCGDIDDPAQLEALFLRLQARRVVEARWRAVEPAPPGSTAILGRYTPDRQAADSNALLRWCEKHGLEFMVFDGMTGEYFATLAEGAPGYARQ